MEQVKNLLISVLVFSIIALGTTYIATTEIGYTGNVPGSAISDDLIEEIGGYSEDINSVAETTEATGSIGAIGLAKTLVFSMPKFVGALFYDVASFLGIPSGVVLFGVLILLVIAAISSALFFRGVSLR